MDFGPNSQFAPHSPLSYSNSYAPIVSPVKNQQGQPSTSNGLLKFAQQSPKRSGQTVGQRGGSRSILKNTGIRPRQRSNSAASTQSERGKQQQTAGSKQQPARKETLKTVAFGMTTNLDDTVLAKEGTGGAIGRNNNNKMKTVIFSHEAQSLHRLIMAQQEELDGFRKMNNELFNMNAQLRKEAREQMDIIAGLSDRLYDLEKRLMNSSSIGRGREESEQTLLAEVENEADEQGKGRAKEEELENGVGDKQQSKKKQRSSSKSNKGAKKPVLTQRNNNVQEISSKDCDQVEKVPAPNRQIIPAASIVPPANDGDQQPRRRNDDILDRLDLAMQQNPTLEKRVHTMLRLWTEDSTSPGPVFKSREESCGPSMLVRVTTQRQEVFYSTSPGRRHNRQPAFARVLEEQQPTGDERRRKRQQHPVVLEPSDDEEMAYGNGRRMHQHDTEEEETPQHRIETHHPNVRRSDHCTDDAEFFQNNEDEEEEEENHVGHWGNDNQQQQQNLPAFNRYRKREANSAVRNQYRRN